MVFNIRKPRNKNLTSRNNSNRRKLLFPRRNNKAPVDTLIQEITDEYGMLEDFTIESASTVESVGSGDSGATVVEMDTLGHKNNSHNMGWPSVHFHLDHNSLPYDFFNLMMSEDFGRGILQEFTNTRASMEGAGRKGDWDRT